MEGGPVFFRIGNDRLMEFYGNIYFLVGKLMMPPENREDPAGR